MLTKNFYRWLGCIMFSRQSSSSKVYLASDDMININGTSVYQSWNYGSITAKTVMCLDEALNNPTTGTGLNGFVQFGSGSTASFEDYKLTSKLTGLNFTVISISSSYDSTTQKFKIEAKFSITNTEATSKTIREVGLFMTGGQGNSSADRKFLVDHTILDTPVVIPGGGVGVVNYTIEYTVPQGNT